MTKEAQSWRDLYIPAGIGHRYQEGVKTFLQGQAKGCINRDNQVERRERRESQSQKQSQELNRLDILAAIARDTAQAENIWDDVEDALFDDDKGQKEGQKGWEEVDLDEETDESKESMQFAYT